MQWKGLAFGPDLSCTGYRLPKESGMDITKIVITGGPCAGKTTAMNWIQHAFTERGYDVLFLSLIHI